MHDFINEWDQKRTGFAGTGIGNANEIPSGQDMRNCLVLDRRGSRITTQRDIALNVLVHWKICKILPEEKKCTARPGIRRKHTHRAQFGFGGAIRL